MWLTRMQYHLSIEMFTDNLRQSYAQSKASDDLTKYIHTTVSVDIYKCSTNQFGRKVDAKIEKGRLQSIAKLIGTLTVVRCIFAQIWKS